MVNLLIAKFLSRESSDKYLDPETIAIKKLERNSSLPCLRRIQVDFNDLCLFCGSIGYQGTLHSGKYTISHMAIVQVPLCISNNNNNNIIINDLFFRIFTIALFLKRVIKNVRSHDFYITFQSFVASRYLFWITIYETIYETLRIFYLFNVFFFFVPIY